MARGAKRKKPVAQRVRTDLFIDAVCRGETATRAIIEAGFTGSTARDAAWRMMRDPEVRKEIDRRQQDALAEAGVTRTMIVKELGRLAFADVRKVLDEFGNVKPFHELDDDTAAAIAGMDVEELFEYTGKGGDKQREQTGFVRKLKFWSKREALSELAAIARLKSEAPQVAAQSGPGLQVIVQQIVKQGEERNVVGQHVVVNLPRPG